MNINIMFRKFFFVALSMMIMSCGIDERKKTTSHNNENREIRTEASYEIKERKENPEDGFVWYWVKKDNFVGVLDQNENVLIEPEYDSVFYDERSGKFIVRDADERCGLIDKAGKILIYPVMGYSGIYSRKIDSSRYYFIVTDSHGREGIFDKSGKEIIVPRYKEVLYSEIDEPTVSCNIKTFYTTDKSRKERILPYYVDSNGDIQPYPLPKWKRLFKNIGYYSSTKDDYVYEDLGDVIVYNYGDKIFFGFIECEKCGFRYNKPMYKVVIEDDGDIWTRLVYFDNWKLIEEDYDSGLEGYIYSEGEIFNYSDFQVEITEQNENASSSSTLSSGIGSTNDSGKTDEFDYSTPQIQERTPIRNQCRSCRNTGRCIVCGGSGKTKTHLSVGYNEGLKAVPEDCRSCGGSGRCHACGGDGWLDEGKDF